jgi:hypothetical protein
MEQSSNYNFDDITGQRPSGLETPAPKLDDPALHFEMSSSYGAGRFGGIVAGVPSLVEEQNRG